MLSYSSDSTEEDMKIFQNINTETERIQFLCFTSKVTVGADIQTRFDRVYVHADSRGGCSARDVFQMIGRARRLTDTRVRVVLPAGHKPVASDELNVVKTPEMSGYKRALQQLLRDRDLRHKYMECVSNSNPELIDGALRWTADWITKVLACHIAERDSDFLKSFGTLASMKQYAFAMPPEQPLASQEVDALKAAKERIGVAMQEADMRQQERLLAALQARPQLDFKEELKHLERRCTQGSASPEEHTQCELLRVCSLFPGYYKSLSAQDIKDARRLKPALFKLQCLKGAPLGQDHSWRDMVKLHRAQLPEQTKMAFQQVRLVNLAAQAVGFKDALDSNTVVLGDKFATHSATVVKHCNEAARFENRRVRAKSQSAGILAANALDRELRYIGHHLVPHRKRQREERVREYQISPLPEVVKLLPHVHFTLEEQVARIVILPECPPRPVIQDDSDEELLRLLGDCEVEEDTRSYQRQREKAQNLNFGIKVYLFTIARCRRHCRMYSLMRRLRSQLERNLHWEKRDSLIRLYSTPFRRMTGAMHT
jgi:hypothetical protein